VSAIASECPAFRPRLDSRDQARFLVAAVTALPARSFLIDGEAIVLMDVQLPITDGYIPTRRTKAVEALQPA
jgi:hypothetical protein